MEKRVNPRNPAHIQIDYVLAKCLRTAQRIWRCFCKSRNCPSGKLSRKRFKASYFWRIDLLIYSYLLYEFEVSARHQVQLFYWEFYSCFFSSESIYLFRAKHVQKVARISLLCMFVSLSVCFCLFEAGKGHTWPCFITFPRARPPNINGMWWKPNTTKLSLTSITDD